MFAHFAGSLGYNITAYLNSSWVCCRPPYRRGFIIWLLFPGGKQRTIAYWVRLVTGWGVNFDVHPFASATVKELMEKVLAQVEAKPQPVEVYKN